MIFAKVRGAQVTALDELKKIDDDLPVLMITAFASVDSAITAMSRSICAVPPISPASPRSTRRDPNPRRSGGVTGGPPLSRHSMRMRPSLMLQDTSTRPASFESAPYFTAFVPNSCIAMDSDSAAFGDSRTAGPFAVNLSGWLPA